MTDKTIAEVLDKSIDKLSGGATEVAKTIKSMAPHAWEVAVRQQVLDGIVWCVIWLVFLVPTVVVARVAIRRFHDDKADPDGTISAALVAGFAALLLSMALLMDGRKAIGKIANPEYYAAMAILGADK